MSRRPMTFSDEDYVPPPRQAFEETPFVREIERQYFGPRNCPGYNYADCENKIEGPTYFCASCTAKSAAFREQLRKER